MPILPELSGTQIPKVAKIPTLRFGLHNFFYMEERFLVVTQGVYKENC